ncbi:hypothetical protein ACG9HW_16005 [Acinetobacter ursingii]|jgi:hypothetical protein|uniref:hypothetical protein n=1 Tax=Acinetobacter TaxID=469 RepID=UPI003AF70C8E
MYINKSVIAVIAVAIFSQSTFTMAATKPAQTFSRANCGLGWYNTSIVGWWNESVSYDGFKGTHNMSVQSRQTTSQGESRTIPKHSQTAGYRVYSGVTDFITDKRFWTVRGSHSETLNDRTIVNSNTIATACNLDISQFI